MTNTRLTPYPKIMAVGEKTVKGCKDGYPQYRIIMSGIITVE
jgi:hypothetical protein